MRPIDYSSLYVFVIKTQTEIKISESRTFQVPKEEEADGLEKAAKAANLLVRIVSEGHMLADHSYDHMFHNSHGPNNAYNDVESDIT